MVHEFAMGNNGDHAVCCVKRRWVCGVAIEKHRVGAQAGRDTTAVGVSEE